MLDKKIFSTGVDHLQTYYSRTLDPFARRVWYRHLSQLSDEQFELAVEAAIASKHYLPTPSELVELVQGNSAQIAAEEWEVCLKAAQRGTVDGFMLSDTALQALRAIGGVSGLGMATSDRLPWLRKEFIEQWKAYHLVPSPAPVVGRLSVAAPAGALPERVSDAIANIAKPMSGGQRETLL
jgi:hypothetical protein